MLLIEVESMREFPRAPTRPAERVRSSWTGRKWALRHHGLRCREGRYSEPTSLSLLIKCFLGMRHGSRKRILWHQREDWVHKWAGVRSYRKKEWQEKHLRPTFYRRFIADSIPVFLSGKGRQMGFHSSGEPVSYNRKEEEGHLHSICKYLVGLTFGVERSHALPTVRPSAARLLMYV